MLKKVMEANMTQPTSNTPQGDSKPIVMSAISEDVKWRDDREQIVRYADERLAMEHPTVVAEMKRLRDENRELRHRYYDEAILFEELALLVKVPLRKISQYKALIRAHRKVIT